MTTMTLLTCILAFLMFITSGRSGVYSFISLVINFVLLFITIVLIAGGIPAIGVSFFSGICILAITIYMGNSGETETDIAFLATVLVMGIMLVLIIPVEHLAQVQGFSNEDSEEIEAFNLAIGVNFESIIISTIVLSTLGAIAEAAIAVSSGMQEIIEQKPTIELNDLRKSGRNIGHQIMGMTFNTLFFGMFGGNLALFILLYKLQATFGYYLNSKVFVSETMLVLYASIAVIMIIWTTSELMVHRLAKQRKKNSK
ncbi:membrane spanning protein [Liquorilactobacillus sucicola DSM 21376 = JCM 15457]|uniref:Integral membrane protein n=1 Tax=Liquorilactobacillus sucicola DSM 21376 = JCM 15457 TaxID=1423806 RepID=A0A023CZM0_9LACO|nr:YibE/F family protein [Liquorilactobacillus sucicola]KRN07230.1 integral membrane protein [Liquorilactobacillus sucicola DSM 21376 = JCM 15457]GAJ27363.1 membrane spanning protein [Liquorilactobacillus sucicola DSM 21376 = JCM 15457]